MEKVRYPENLMFIELIKTSGKTITFLSEKVGCSREILSRTINGHYKGENIVKKLKKELGFAD